MINRQQRFKSFPVEWLRRNLTAYGLTLRPQQLVLTGTPLGLYPVQPGDSVRVMAKGLGSVEATVTVA